MPACQHVVTSVAQKQSPLRRGRLGAHAQETEAGSSDNGGSDGHGVLYDDIGNGAGQDMFEQDAHVACSDVAGGLDKHAVLCLQCIAPHQTGKLGDVEHRNRDYHIIKSASQDGHNGNCQDKSREGQQHVADTHDDGINDAAAMKAADIGISVDTAVDVAKESADIILLEKDLMVLEEGIIEGRKTYANMIKYIKMTASSNFGNMFSVLAASALLPFLPMMSVHLIFLNLIYDLSCTAIPWDNVDEEFIAKPRKWDASSVGSFMIWIGPTSSIFDFTTYIFMYFVFCPLFVSKGILFNDLAAHYSGVELATMQARYIGMFQAGWFVESMWSQTLVIHMIRTPKLPFIQSRASAPVTLLTMTGIAVLTVIPFTPFGAALGLVALPASYFAYLIPCILLYMMLATSLKKAYVRYYGELL